MATQYGRKKMISRKTKVAIGAGAAVAVALPAVAWAAINLFGFGDFEAAAGTSKVLVVDNTTVTKTLVPGGKTGTKGIVRNPNDFPIKVTHVIVKNDSVAGTGEGCDQNSLTLLGTPAPYPLAQDEGATGSAAGTKQEVAEQVTIAPGQAAWVTVPESVEQKPTATTLCGLKGRYAVVATNATGS